MTCESGEGNVWEGVGYNISMEKEGQLLTAQYGNKLLLRQLQ
jgi:hypothetical protein